MIKYFLYPVLFLCVLGVFCSCESKNDTEYSVVGKWRVISRTFVCESDPDLQKTVRYLMQKQSVSLLNGEAEYLLFEDGGYEEGEMKWEKIGGGISGLPLDSLLIDKSKFTGVYTAVNDDRIGVTIQNIGSSWSYDLNIADLNNEFLWTKQEMNKADLLVFLEKYFGLPNHTVADGVTAVWETKAAKEKEE